MKTKNYLIQVNYGSGWETVQKHSDLVIAKSIEIIFFSIGKTRVIAENEVTNWRESNLRELVELRSDEVVLN